MDPPPGLTPGLFKLPVGCHVLPVALHMMASAPPAGAPGAWCFWTKFWTRVHPRRGQPGRARRLLKEGQPENIIISIEGS